MFEQIKEGLQRNKLKKIISLILSIALWFYVMGEQNPVIEDSYRVPITLRDSTPQEKAPFYDADTEARVVLSAPRSYFIDYNESDIKAYIDISSYNEGEYDVKVEANYPKGFELVNIFPETVHIKIEPIIERQMNLELIPSGAPKQGNLVTGIESPQNVTVVGTRSASYNVNKVVGYIGITGEDRNFDLNVPLSAVDENGREVKNIRVVPAAVDVTVKIEPSIKKKIPVVANLKVPAGKEISNLKVEPSTVEVEGTAYEVDNINSINTVETKIPEGSDKFNAVLKLAPLTEHVTVYADEVFVTGELKSVANNTQN